MNLDEFVTWIDKEVKDRKFEHNVKAVTHICLMVDQVFAILKANETNHCSTEEVIDILSNLYSRNFGLLFPSVAREVGIGSWKDIGSIILFLTEIEIYKRGADDRIEDYIEADKKTPLFALVESKTLDYIKGISNGKADTSNQQEESGSN